MAASPERIIPDAPIGLDNNTPPGSHLRLRAYRHALNPRRLTPPRRPPHQRWPRRRAPSQTHHFAGHLQEVSEFVHASATGLEVGSGRSSPHEIRQHDVVVGIGSFCGCGGVPSWACGEPTFGPIDGGESGGSGVFGDLAGEHVDGRLRELSDHVIVSQ